MTESAVTGAAFVTVRPGVSRAVADAGTSSAASARAGRRRRIEQIIAGTRDGVMRSPFGDCARRSARQAAGTLESMPTASFGRFEKVLRIGEGRRLKRLAEQAAYITSLEPDFEELSDAELLGKTAEFKQRIENGESLEEILYEAFAAVREARKRESGQRLFDVQLMGGIVLHEGDIAEMKTGEGKTFVASAPLYLNALAGDNVHLVTVNDYLAKRDAEWNRPVYDRLGVSVAWIENMMPFARRREAYAADITYGTNSEFGFDYLRDNMAVSLEGTVQRGHVFAIVDEVDSILIDEARTPLIISGEPETAAKTYYDFARVVRELEQRAADPQGDEGRGRDGALGRRLPLRREVQDRLTRTDGARQGRARARDRQPLRPAQRPARQPPHPGAQGRSRSTSATSTTSCRRAR